MEPDPSVKVAQSKGAAIPHAADGKIPYAYSIKSLLDINSIANGRSGTPSMSGHLPVDGMRSQQIGSPIRRLC
jgi:hypothetical protein